MCGFAVVISKKNKIQHSLIKIAEEELRSRGPSSQTHYLSDDTYIYQSTLSIQTKPTHHNNLASLPEDYDLLLYNGEIYDDHSFSSDTEYLKSGNLEEILGECDGMFSVATISKKGNRREIAAYRDIIGEKRSFYYDSSSLFVLASTPSFIYKVLREYDEEIAVNETALKDYFVTRHYISNSTGIRGIYQLPPGHKLTYSNYLNVEKIWSPRSYLNKEMLHHCNMMTPAQYAIELEKLLCNTLRKMQRTVRSHVKVASIVSGGVDSSLVSYFLDQIGVDVKYGLTLTFGTKDKVALNAHKLFDKLSFQQIEYNVKTKEYYNSYLNCLDLCCSPIHSHDFASADILYGLLFSPGVLYGGDGADELFLGYKYYQNCIRSEYAMPVRNSFIFSIAKDIQDDYDYAFDFFLVNGYSTKDAHIKSCSFVDFFHQLPSTNLLMGDLIGSDHGIECRTPFTRKDIVTFAINSPVKLLLDKQPLKKLFSQSFGIYPYPKQGFAGHPNELIRYLPKGPYDSYNIFGHHTLDREILWKYINTEFFLLNLTNSQTVT